MKERAVKLASPKMKKIALELLWLVTLVGLLLYRPTSAAAQSDPLLCYLHGGKRQPNQHECLVCIQQAKAAEQLRDQIQKQLEQSHQRQEEMRQKNDESQRQIQEQLNQNLHQMRQPSAGGTGQLDNRKRAAGWFVSTYCINHDYRFDPEVMRRINTGEQWSSGDSKTCPECRRERADTLRVNNDVNNGSVEPRPNAPATGGSSSVNQNTRNGGEWSGRADATGDASDPGWGFADDWRQDQLARALAAGIPGPVGPKGEIYGYNGRYFSDDGLLIEWPNAAAREASLREMKITRARTKALEDRYAAEKYYEEDWKDAQRKAARQWQGLYELGIVDAANNPAKNGNAQNAVRQWINTLQDVDVRKVDSLNGRTHDVSSDTKNWVEFYDNRLGIQTSFDLDTTLAKARESYIFQEEMKDVRAGLIELKERPNPTINP